MELPQTRKTATERSTQYLSIPDAAQETQTSIGFWRKYIAAGQLPVVQLGRAVRIKRSDFLAFLESRRGVR